METGTLRSQERLDLFAGQNAIAVGVDTLPAEALEESGLPRARDRVRALPTPWSAARPQRAIAPGQAAVCYEGDAVALGGVIESRL